MSHDIVQTCYQTMSWMPSECMPSQWLCNTKRALKLLTLNGSLRLMHYMENNPRFPRDDELLEHLETERAEHNIARHTLLAEEEVALGLRHMYPYIHMYTYIHIAKCIVI